MLVPQRRIIALTDVDFPSDTALVHHLRDISLLYLSSSSHTTASSGFITVPQRLTSSPPQANAPLDGQRSGPSSGDSSNTTASGSSYIHVPHPHLRQKLRGSVDGPQPGSLVASSSGSTIRHPEDGARAAYLSAGDLDGDDSEDAEAWSTNAGWWTGVGVEQVDEVKEGTKALEELIAGGKLHPGELLVRLSP